MDLLCRVRSEIMYVLLWRTVYALTQVLFWWIFPSLLRNSGNKHQNYPLVSARTVRHTSTYIIFYIWNYLPPGMIHSPGYLWEVLYWTEPPTVDLPRIALIYYLISSRSNAFPVICLTKIPTDDWLLTTMCWKLEATRIKRMCINTTRPQAQALQRAALPCVGHNAFANLKAKCIAWIRIKMFCRIVKCLSV